MRNLMLLVVFYILCTSGSCKRLFDNDNNPYVYWVQNNSADTIFFQVSKSFPDTAIPQRGAANPVFLVVPGKRFGNYQYQEWNEFFSELPADTLSVFFFSKDTLDKYDFEDLRNNYRILKRKDVSYSDLKSNNYTIEYP